MEGCRSACLTERIQSSFLLAQDCSSDGAAQLALQDVAVWAFQHKVSFHVGAEKSVALAKQQEVQPILVFPVVGASPQEVCVRPSHRWLGLLWPANHDFLPALLQAVHAAESHVLSIVGLVSSGGLPLAFGLLLFESKVDGFLRFSRWILATADGADEVYNRAFDKWGRLFLCSMPWRSAEVAACELGWSLSGFGRAVVDVALRRAKLWSLPPSDLYGATLSIGHNFGTTWATKSLCVLESVGVPDLPSLGSPMMPLKLYKVLIRGKLQASCSSSRNNATARHAIPFPYQDLMATSVCLSHPRAWKAMCWDGLKGHYSLCRLRAGLLELGHLRGKKNAAPQIRCIMCEALVRSPYSHVLGECGWLQNFDLPSAWDSMSAREAAFRFLTTTPEQQHFPAVARACSAIELAHEAFWR